ncbi:M16 family metallopeptidase [Pelagicoccus albus]|uniref:Insulinase family protein n=1 Tax=Pelagicoccus albus TaxID=415222 RepID=A0A7X1B7S4_9BACT|nr:insulinase family protein [Pelagicoccus albus]MBC2606984.1 insulinase family protein [Pelagicoccus albus]
MFKKSSVFVAVASLLSIFVAPSQAKSVFGERWPITPDGAPSSENEVWGELPNGLRYAIIPTDAPSGAVSIRLLVAAGQAQESEGTLGFSTLVSKMALEGTKSFDSHELARYRLANGVDPDGGGLATVGIDYTIYRLDLEEPEADAVKEGVSIFGEIASSVPFESGHFDEVRADLVFKGRFGFSYFQAEQARLEGALLKSSPYMEIEDAEVVEDLLAASSDDAKAFWSNWYTADRMVLAVVGVADPALVESAIKESFAAARSSAEQSSIRELDARFRGKGDIVTGEPRGPYAGLMISYVEEGLDLFKPEQEKELYVYDMIGRYAQSLAIDSSGLGAPAVEVMGDAVIMSVKQRGSVMQLQENLIAADKAMHQIEKFGIQKSDLETLKSDYLSFRNGYDPLLSVKGWPRMLADRLVKNTIDGIPFRYGKDFGAYLERVVSSLPQSEVDQLCKRIFSEKQLAYYVEVPKAFGLPAKSIAKKLKATRKSYNYAWEQSGDVDLNAVFGAAFQNQAMVESTEILRFDEYPVLQYEFANNLRVNVIQTDEFGGRIIANVSFGNGISDLQNQGRAFAVLANSILEKTKVGRGAHAPYLKDVLKTKGVDQLEVSVDIDQLSWKAYAGKQDSIADFFSGLVFWMATNELTEEDFNDELEKMTKALERSRKSEASQLDKMLLGSELRLAEYFETEDLEGLDYTGMKTWLQKVREESYIEVTVVGDVVPRTVLRDVRKSFGAAPTRTGKVLQPRHAKPVVWGEPGIDTAKSEGAIETGSLTLLFPQVEEKSCIADKRMDIFHSLLELHLREALREYPTLEDSLAVTVIGRRMVPMSRAVKVQVRVPRGDSEEAKEVLLSAIESFAASIEPALLEAAERSAWISLKRIARSEGRLIDLFSQSQGRPNTLRCALDLLENGISEPVEVYQEVAAEQFSVENLRGVILTP